MSDPFCAHRHRDEWLDLLTDKVDLVSANEEEITALFETDDVDATARKVGDLVPLAAVTRAELGSVIVAGKLPHWRPTPGKPGRPSHPQREPQWLRTRPQ